MKSYDLSDIWISHLQFSDVDIHTYIRTYMRDFCKFGDNMAFTLLPPPLSECMMLGMGEYLSDTILLWPFQWLLARAVQSNLTYHQRQNTAHMCGYSCFVLSN